jgi:hypothetical protein
LEAIKATNGQLNRFARSVNAIKEHISIKQVAQEYFEARLVGSNGSWPAAQHPITKTAHRVLRSLQTASGLSASGSCL